MTKKIKFSVQPNAVQPKKGRAEDVGYDLTVYSVKVASKGALGLQTFMIDFGVKVEPPENYYFELVPRSSLAWSGFIMPNSVGIIDPDYRGTLKMPLIYLGSATEAEDKAKTLIGTRIAQLILRQKHTATFIQVSEEELSLTVRGKQGFGSSGL